MFSELCYYKRTRSMPREPVSITDQLHAVSIIYANVQSSTALHEVQLIQTTSCHNIIFRPCFAGSKLKIKRAALEVS